MKATLSSIQTKLGSLGLLALTLCGCGTVERPPADPNLLNFLDQGAVNRKETVEHLGKPFSTAVGGRIAFYRLGKTKRGLFVREPHWEKQSQQHHSLVLLYGADNSVTNHSLIRVK